MIERSPRGAEEFRLPDEDVDGDSETLRSPRTVLLPPDRGAESENWVETDVFTVSGNEAELPVTSADVLLWVRNQRAVLSPPVREDLEAAPACDVEVELPWSSELLASCRSAKAGRCHRGRRHYVERKESSLQLRSESSLREGSRVQEPRGYYMQT